MLCTTMWSWGHFLNTEELVVEKTTLSSWGGLGFYWSEFKNYKLQPLVECSNRSSVCSWLCVFLQIVGVCSFSKRVEYIQVDSYVTGRFQKNVLQNFACSILDCLATTDSLSNCFVLVRVMENPESILGTLSMEQEYTLIGTPVRHREPHTLSHLVVYQYQISVATSPPNMSLGGWRRLEILPLHI